MRISCFLHFHTEYNSLTMNVAIISKKSFPNPTLLVGFGKLPEISAFIQTLQVYNITSFCSRFLIRISRSSRSRRNFETSTISAPPLRSIGKPYAKFHFSTSSSFDCALSVSITQSVSNERILYCILISTI